ncbi:MAG TPA: prolipoprotein diacylglyceryl transferase family protein [Anaerolineales bacterium]|nr:prolipoprotein diacylglyceryl transferase family protein [Anaerolineales bacterium]
MYPVLFYIGSIPIWSYGTFIALGMTLLFAMALLSAQRDGRSWEQLLPMAMGVVAGGVFGARLSHLIVEPDKFGELIDFYSLFRPGTPGNVLGLMVGGYLGGLVVRRSLDLPSLGNYFAPALAAASVMLRIGCVLAGACHGRVTTLPTVIRNASLTENLPPVYDGLFNLAFFLLLWRLRRRVTRDNALLYLYFAAYAFFRFWLEFMADYPPIALGLTGVQFLCLAILVGQGVGLWRERARRGSALPTQGGTA